jgi:hypothetical protein
MPDQDLIGSDVLVIVPRENDGELAQALTERFAGVPGLRVIEDRRRPWPQGERRNRVAKGIELAPDHERRLEQRRGSHSRGFLGALVTPAGR